MEGIQYNTKAKFVGKPEEGVVNSSWRHLESL